MYDDIYYVLSGHGHCRSKWQGRTQSFEFAAQLFASLSIRPIASSCVGTETCGGLANNSPPGSTLPTTTASSRHEYLRELSQGSYYSPEKANHGRR